MITIFIIDGSQERIKILCENLNSKLGLRVIGSALDPFKATQQLQSLRPQIIILDLDSQGFEGLDTVKNCNKEFASIITLSSKTKDGLSQSIFALRNGASAVMAKPQNPNSIGLIVDELLDKIKYVKGLKKSPERQPIKQEISENKFFPKILNMKSNDKKIIVIGASTGGVEALIKILPKFPKNCPPVLIVQHMPYKFTKYFADTVNDLCQCEVKEAKDHENLRSGLVLVAPGDYHMVIEKNVLNKGYLVSLNKEELVNYQRPAVDVLFNSIADLLKENAIGVILTGMGKDGAAGLKKMHDKGAKTIAQDEATSAVYGMPKEAIESGAVDFVLPLEKIAAKIIELCNA